MRESDLNLLVHTTTRFSENLAHCPNLAPRQTFPPAKRRFFRFFFWKILNFSAWKSAAGKVGAHLERRQRFRTSENTLPTSCVPEDLNRTPSRLRVSRCLESVLQSINMKCFLGQCYVFWGSVFFRFHIWVLSNF